MELNNREISNKVRVIHRYLGFFLTGIMAMYAISGMTLIFRQTEFLKKEVVETRQLPVGLAPEELAPELKMKVEFQLIEGDVYTFGQSTYDAKTGIATIKEKRLPYLLDKMTKVHKATHKSPLYFMNLFFGLSLLFFVISTFWMFLPSTSVFKKGMYFALGGVVLFLIMILV
jgi:hypothetical protein